MEIMTKFSYKIWILSLLLSCSFVANATTKCTLNVAWMERPSYQYKDHRGNPQGLDIELMKAIGRDLNCTINFRYMPWTRQLVEIQRGTIDLVLGIVLQGENEKVEDNKIDGITVTDTFRVDLMSFYWLESTRRKFKVSQSFTQLVAQPIRVGLVEHDFRSAELEKLSVSPRTKSKFRYIRVVKGVLNNVKNGHVDGIILHAEEAEFYLKNSPIKGLVRENQLSYQTDVYIGLADSSPLGLSFIDKLNESLARLRKNGTYDRLSTQYAPTHSPLKK